MNGVRQNIKELSEWLETLKSVLREKEVSELSIEDYRFVALDEYKIAEVFILREPREPKSYRLRSAISWLSLKVLLLTKHCTSAQIIAWPNVHLNLICFGQFMKGRSHVLN